MKHVVICTVCLHGHVHSTYITVGSGSLSLVCCLHSLVSTGVCVQVHLVFTDVCVCVMYNTRNPLSFYVCVTE